MKRGVTTLTDLVLREDENILGLLARVAEATEGSPEREAAEREVANYSGSLPLRAKVDAYSRVMAFFDRELRPGSLT